MLQNPPWIPGQWVVPNPTYTMFFSILTGGQHTQCGYAGQGDDSCPGWDSEIFNHITQNGMQFKTYELLFLQSYI